MTNATLSPSPVLHEIHVVLGAHALAEAIAEANRLLALN
jgi:hypothetical protein